MPEAAMLPAFLAPPAWLAWLIWPIALAATLVLAAWCTPRAWWRRPNLCALAVLAGGTLGFGLLFAHLLPAAPAVGAVPATLASAPAPAWVPAAAPPPAPGARWRVVDDLNLRAERGVRGVRMHVLAAGTIVRTTGATDGDWWRVRARVDGRDLEGWASSLWLRRADEAPAAH